MVKDNKLILLIGLIALAIRLINITAPYGFGHLGWGGTFYSNVARNYFTYGFIATKFGPVVNTGVVDPSEFSYYLHLPAMLFYMLLGLSFKIFGVHEWAARLIPLLFSMGNLILIYTLAKNLWNNKVALFASFLFAVVPIAAIYGTHVDVQSSLTVFFILLIFFCYSKWIYNPKGKYYWLMVASFLVGSQTDWPVYYVLPAIVLHHIFTSKKIKKEILLLPLLGVFTFSLHLLYMKFLTGSFMGTGRQGVSLLEAFKWRTSSGASDLDHSLSFNLAQFIRNSILYLSSMYTTIIILLSGVWGINLIIKFFRKENKEKDLFLVSLFLVGIIHVVLFKQGAWTHEFWFVYLLPGFIISSALTIELLLNKMPKKNSVVLVTLILIIFSVNSTHTVLTKHRQCYNDATRYCRSLGIFIKENTEVTDRIVLSGENLITRYYAHRNMIMGINTVNKLRKTIKKHKDYNYFIIHKNSGKRTLMNFLIKNYSLSVKDGYLFFRLDRPL